MSRFVLQKLMGVTLLRLVVMFFQVDVWHAFWIMQTEAIVHVHIACEGLPILTSKNLRRNFKKPHVITFSSHMICGVDTWQQCFLENTSLSNKDWDSVPSLLHNCLRAIRRKIHTHTSTNIRVHYKRILLLLLKFDTFILLHDWSNNSMLWCELIIFSWGRFNIKWFWKCFLYGTTI